MGRTFNFGKKILEWSIWHFKMCFKGGPNVVKKNFIPVVILQNNKGNNSSTTTIIAPITTHRGMKIIGKDSMGKSIVEYFNDDGTTKQKVLDYYERPVELEKDFKQEITGYINLAQIRTVSKNRLDKAHVAIINEETSKRISEGTLKLLAFNQNKMFSILK